MNNSIALLELEKIFNIFNTKYYDNKLEESMITINPTGRKPMYGWCTVKKVWKEITKEPGNGKDYYEICICAESLQRSYNEIAETMLHEMVHLYNLINNINDTSINGRYHNKQYKTQAEAHGLKVDKSIKFGWSTTSLTDKSIEVIDTIKNKNKDAFNVYRQLFPHIKIEAKKMYTYTCNCERKIKSEIEDDILTCNICNGIMMRKVKV